MINGRKPLPRVLAMRLDEVLSAGGELAALAAAAAAARAVTAYGVPAPVRLTTAQQLEVMSGEISALRAEVSALAQTIAFALLADAGKDAGAESSRS